MMPLSFGVLRSRPTRETDLLERLRQYASRLMQGEETSLWLWRTDDPAEFVWIGHQAEEGPGASAWADIADSMGSGVLESATRFSLRFVGGWHRLPAPPYQIWNVEARATATTRVESPIALFQPTGGADADALVGRSVFRAVEDPARFIGFVALTGSWIRRHDVSRHGVSGTTGTTAIWRRLTTIYRVEAVRASDDARLPSLFWTGVEAASLPSPVGLLP